MTLANPKAESEFLMNELYPFAEKMLIERGEFHPFGGFISQTGKMVHFSVVVKARPLNERAKLGKLIEGLRGQAVIGARAIGHVSNVSLPLKNGKARDAIQVNLEHRHGLCAEMFFVYELEPEKCVTVLDTFAQEGHRTFFPESAEKS